MTFTDWSINSAGMPGQAGPTGVGNVSNVATPTIGQLAQWTDANHIQGLSPTVLGGGCGRLQLVNATTLQYKPYRGNGIVVNGQLYAIPASGIVGLGTTGVFVGGVAGQNLAANTSYNVYVFNNGGVPTADYVAATVGHSPSTTPGNIGTEIKNGDDTRSLIGLVAIDGNVNFRDENLIRYVRSWFNGRSVAAFVENTAWGPSNSAGYVPLGSCYIALWSGESCLIVCNVNYYINDAAVTIWFRPFVDSVGVGNEVVNTNYNVGWWTSVSSTTVVYYTPETGHVAQAAFHQDGTANRIQGGASVYATALGLT